MTRIALISDLHVGSSRAKDLNPELTGLELCSDYLAEFREFVSETFDQTFEYLLITGDVTNGASKQEVILASSTIEYIADTLGVEHCDVFWVPGNHDRCWSLISAHSDPGRAYEFFDENPDHLLKSSEIAANGALLREPHACVWDKPEVLVAGINTSVGDTAASPIHHGVAEDELIEELLSLLASVDTKKNRPWIFILHHHPISYDDDSGYWKDFSQLQNNARLRAVLADLQFDLVIHGHRHHPNLTYELSDVGHGRTFVCAGSFSAPLSFNDRLLNQFHSITLNQRETRDVPLSGTLENWSHGYPYGWGPSKSSIGGIEHRIRFGNIMDFEVAKALVIASLAAYLPKKVVRWVDLIEEVEDLRHLPARLVRRVLSSIESDGPWRLHDFDDLDNVLLFIE